MISKFIKFLVRKIPRPFLIRCSGGVSWLVRPFYAGNRYECPICQHTFRKFLPYGKGGGANRLCPQCLSLERHRQMWLYLTQYTDFFSTRLKVLHIAPEQPFVPIFRKMKNLDYQTADLVSPLADLHFDVLNIPLPDKSYDVIFCNHVLEHVTDDQQAMREFFRVLKPDGWAILQVPLNPQFAQTYEDKSITSPREREQHFGQYDHLRLYGRDYPQLLQAAGFTVREFDLNQHLTPEQIDRYRLWNEMLYIAEKK